MRTFFATILLLTSICADPVLALDLTNVRVTAGPLGPKRLESKFLPGDLLYLAFDIQDIHVDKSGWVAFQTTMEIFDTAGKEAFKQATPAQKVLLLGGSRVPTSTFATLGANQAPGKYKVKISVNDILGKVEKSFLYEFEVLPKAFGIVQPATPAVSFAGFEFAITFALAGMGKDKDKLPDVALTVQLFDEKGAAVLTKPLEFNVQLLHNPPVADLTTKDVIQVSFPLFLNRAGKYTIQVDAYDEVSKEKRQIKMSLRVLDPVEFIGS